MQNPIIEYCTMVINKYKLMLKISFLTINYSDFAKL